MNIFYRKNYLTDECISKQIQLYQKEAVFKAD